MKKSPWRPGSGPQFWPGRSPHSSRRVARRPVSPAWRRWRCQPVPITTQGTPIGERRGTDGCDRRLPRRGQLPGGGRGMRHDPQDGEEDHRGARGRRCRRGRRGAAAVEAGAEDAELRPVAELVAAKVKASHGRISAKRLLPTARAAGYAGSARNFRRLVAQAKGQLATRAAARRRASSGGLDAGRDDGDRLGRGTPPAVGRR